MKVNTLVIILLSALFLFITAVFSIGYAYPDEHFQILEFAALKLGLTSAADLPWEYHFRIRSAIQPLLAYWVHLTASEIGITSPFNIAFMLRLMSGILTFLSMLMMYNRYKNTFKNSILQKWFLMLSFLIWFAIGQGVRFTSETWSGGIFIMAYCIYFSEKLEYRKALLFLTGFLAGISFLFRFQTGFLMAGFFLWMIFIHRERLIHLILITSGILTAILFGLFADRWFYGAWTVSFYNYFIQNIIQDKLSGFGIQPWWFYFTDTFIRAIPPFSLIYIICFPVLFIFKRKDPLTWILFPFLLVHFIAGHKETRFLFPVMGFLPVVIIQSVTIISERWSAGITVNKITRYLVNSFWVFNFIALFVVAFSPSDPQVTMFKKIYQEFPGPATLYYIDENPYYRAKEIRYYRRMNLSVKQLHNWSEIRHEKGRATILVAKKKDDIRQLPMNKRLVYTSFPDWIKNYNFNNWIERTNFWYVYELK